MHMQINWFEIPSADFARAVKFYEQVFDCKLKVEEMGSFPMAIFQRPDGESVGCVIHGEPYQPSAQGLVLYFDAGQSMDDMLGRVRPAGGRILMDKMKLPGDIGSIAHFTDTEGNRIALHAAP